MDHKTLLSKAKAFEAHFECLNEQQKHNVMIYLLAQIASL